MDTISYKRKIVPRSVVCGVDSFLGVCCIPVLTKDDVAAISPLPIDGLYHSDVASCDSQPNLFSRIQKLPKSFAPRGMEDEDLFTLAMSRSMHDISDSVRMQEIYAKQLEDEHLMQQEDPPSDDPAPSVEEPVASE